MTRELAAALVAVALAGCVGGGASGGDDAAPSAAALDLGPASPAAARGANLSFALPSVSTTQWFNGTWKAQEAWSAHDAQPPLLPPNPASIRQHDISDMLPIGVPARITARLESSMQQGDLDMWLQVPFVDVWTSFVDAPYGGTTSVEQVVAYAGAEPARVNVFYDVMEPVAEFDYTLSVRVEYDAAVLPAGVPVGIELPEAGLCIRLERVSPAVSGHSPAVLVWDPEDRFIGRSAFGDLLDLGLGPDADAGEYVVLLAQGSGSARVSLVNATADAEASPLRVMLQDIQGGTPRPIGTGVHDRLSWSYDAERMPIQTGFFFDSGDAATEVEATLTGPLGALITLAPVDGPIFFSGWAFNTPLGAEGHAAGTYTVDVGLGHAVVTEPRQTQHWLVFHARP